MIGPIFPSEEKVVLVLDQGHLDKIAEIICRRLAGKNSDVQDCLGLPMHEGHTLHIHFDIELEEIA